MKIENPEDILYNKKIKVKSIKISEAIKHILDKNYVFVDTRTPAEFEEDHILNAINIPLLDNEQRKEIGILYKNAGKDTAIKRGFELVNPKLDKMMKRFEKYRNKKIVIYCWRGGMRSGSVTKWLMDLKFDVMQLEGGYKSYRKFIRESLINYKLKPNLLVIKGLTGTGKTDFLRQTALPNIDLEGLAQHRGSVFGKIGLIPRSQKMFETLLYFKLEKLKNEKCILIEGESRKIGNIILPEFLYSAMNRSKHILLECDLKKRTKIIIEDYGDITKNMPEKTKKIIESIRKKLSKKTYQKLIEFIEEHNTEGFVELMLTDYYDPLYKFQIDNHKHNSIIVENIGIEETEQKIKKIIESV